MVARVFTGIVEEVGRIDGTARRGGIACLRVGARIVVADLKVGHSIAVGGACLTATAVDGAGFEVELSHETLRRTSLGGLVAGDAVNLERALAPTTRLGGHFVQGHVDATGEVVTLTPEGASTMARFRAPAGVMRYVVPKGFVAIDGVSLTVVDVDEDTFRVAYIPHTLACTTAGRYTPGTRVNLEADILGKYVERLLASRSLLEVSG